MLTRRPTAGGDLPLCRTINPSARHRAHQKPSTGPEPPTAVRIDSEFFDPPGPDRFSTDRRGREAPGGLGVRTPAYPLHVHLTGQADERRTAFKDTGPCDEQPVSSRPAPSRPQPHCASVPPPGPLRGLGPSFRILPIVNWGFGMTAIGSEPRKNHRAGGEHSIARVAPAGTAFRPEYYCAEIGADRDVAGPWLSRPVRCRAINNVLALGRLPANRPPGASTPR